MGQSPSTFQDQLYPTICQWRKMSTQRPTQCYIAAKYLSISLPAVACALVCGSSGMQRFLNGTLAREKPFSVILPRSFCLSSAEALMGLKIGADDVRGRECRMTKDHEKSVWGELCKIDPGVWRQGGARRWHGETCEIMGEF